jgi:hypothetical protein
MMMSTETLEKALWEEKNLSFKTAAAEDDLLHRQFNDDNRSPLRGEVIAANRLAGWPNMDTWVCLARWECKGQVCYGDLQQVQWHDYVRQFLGW